MKHRPLCLLVHFLSFQLAHCFATSPFEPKAPRCSSSSFATAESENEIVKKDTLIQAQSKIDELILEKNCGPVFVRLAWHDSATYDKSISDNWPTQGGANGSIRFDVELGHGGNAGLNGAVALLQPIKEEFPAMSYADIYQMASARSIFLAGGPVIPMKYGRVDVTDASQCPPEGNLPDAEAGDDGTFGSESGIATPNKDATPNGHLRKVFYRMGLNDEEIVALSGAHTFGRAYKDRSGLGAKETKFTDGTTKEQFRSDGTRAAYKPGGSSWTEQWLVFDNSYFTTLDDDSADPELLKLSSDKTLFDDAEFSKWATKFRDSKDDFFESYAKAHQKLSELGSKFQPEEGIVL